MHHTNETPARLATGAGAQEWSAGSTTGHHPTTFIPEQRQRVAAKVEILTAFLAGTLPRHVAQARCRALMPGGSQ